ncbi:MAG: hypothetical protein IJL26_09430 [Clostridia bacterium]|nr:hypothetical protein [Clostridia bacterium]
MFDKNAAERLALQYGAAFARSGDEIVITNRENGKTIEVLDESYHGGKPEEAYDRYTVYFTTQHRHYEDFEDALDYVERLMRDEILAIEYYRGDERRFGGDIERSELYDPDPPTRGTIFSMLPADHPGLNYEINSWSGKYDLKYEKY